ncbi:hypothetical protein MMC13_002186 [Lambiella insularis]|nr:hypothetical protein [Lambiella insularis]
MTTPNEPEGTKVPYRQNLAGTPDQRHVWTRLELEHAIVLRQYGGDLGPRKITEMLNTHFSTAKTIPTVSHRLQIESATLPPSEVRQRSGSLQPLVSVLWERIEKIGADALEVGLVLFEHGLLTREEFDERIERHRQAWMLQRGTPDMLYSANQIFGYPPAGYTRVQTGASGSYLDPYR